MARLNICGFETGDMSETGTIAGTVTVDSATVRTGTYSLKVVTAASAAVHYATIGGLDASGKSAALGKTTAWFRFYFRIASLPSIFESIVRFCASATVTSATSLGVVTLGIDSSGDVRMYKPGGGTSGIVGRCSINTWYMIEAHVVQNSTCYARINAGTETSLAACGNEVIDYIQLGKGTRLGDGAYTAYFDDIAIDDAAYPGAGQVNIAVPIASGADNAWSASYTNVDEIPHDGNTSYISGGTGRTNFSMQSFATAGGSGNIAAVKASIIARYSNNSNDNYTVSAKSGATYSENSFPTPSSAYTYLARLLTTDPNTSAPWTSAGFDAMYVGVRCSATYTLAARVTAVYAMVESDGVVAYSRTFSSSIGMSSSAARVKAALRNLSASDVHSAGITRAVSNGRTLVVSDTHSASVVRGYGAVRAVSVGDIIASAVAIVRALGRSIVVSDAHTMTVVRLAANVRSVGSAVGVSSGVARVGAHPRILVWTAGHASVGVGQKQIVRGVTGSVGHTSGAARVLGAARALGASVSHAVAWSRAGAYGRAVSAAISASAVIGKVLGAARALGASVGHTSAATGGILKIRTITERGDQLADAGEVDLPAYRSGQSTRVIGGFLYTVESITDPTALYVVDLSNFTSAGVTRIAANAGENWGSSFVIDSTNGFAYVCCAVNVSLAPKIVKFDLSTNTRTGVMTPSNGHGGSGLSTLALANGFLYWLSDNDFTPIVVEIDLSTFTQTAFLTLTGETYGSGMVADPAGNYLYVIPQTNSPGRVLKISTSTFTVVATLSFTGNNNSAHSISISPSGSWLCVSCGTSVYKIDLSTFTIAATITGVSGGFSSDQFWDESTGDLFVNIGSSVTRVSISDWLILGKFRSYAFFGSTPGPSGDANYLYEANGSNSWVVFRYWRWAAGEVHYYTVQVQKPRSISWNGGAASATITATHAYSRVLAWSAAAVVSWVSGLVLAREMAWSTAVVANVVRVWNGARGLTASAASTVGIAKAVNHPRVLAWSAAAVASVVEVPGRSRPVGSVIAHTASMVRVGEFGRTVGMVAGMVAGIVRAQGTARVIGVSVGVSASLVRQSAKIRNVVWSGGAVVFGLVRGYAAVRSWGWVGSGVTIGIVRGLVLARSVVVMSVGYTATIIGPATRVRYVVWAGNPPVTGMTRQGVFGRVIGVTVGNTVGIVGYRTKFRTISATIAQSVSVVRSGGFARGISGTVGVGVGVVAVAARSRAIAASIGIGAVVVFSARVFVRAVGSSVVHVASWSRVVAYPRSVSGVVGIGAGVARGVGNGRTVTWSGQVGSSLGHQATMNRVLTVTLLQATDFARSVTTNRSIGYIVANTTSASGVREVDRSGVFMLAGHGMVLERQVAYQRTLNEAWAMRVIVFAITAIEYVVECAYGVHDQVMELTAGVYSDTVVTSMGRYLETLVAAAGTYAEEVRAEAAGVYSEVV